MLEKQKHQDYCNKKSLNIVESLVQIFRKRKTTRHFEPSQTIDIEIIKNAVAVAGTAPSGANKQPWSFSIVGDWATKQKIRQWAETEEESFYNKKASDNFLNDLKPLHTNSNKPFLTEASFLIPIFYSTHVTDDLGNKSTNYYVKESVGIATGLLISALHLSGLSTLTYTPTNRKFLTELLQRPKTESSFMVLAVGLPSQNALVPTLSKKTLSEILTIYKGVNARTPVQTQQTNTINKNQGDNNETITT